MKKLLPLLILGVAALLAYSWYQKKIAAAIVTGIDRAQQDAFGY